MTAVDHEYEAAKAEYRMDTKDFRAGTYRLHDVSNDPAWSDVKCVESHHGTDGELRGVTNHRERDFKTACQDLEALGAKPQ